MHGLGLIVNHCFRKFLGIKLNRLFAWFLTFNYINITFLMFRAESVSEFVYILTKMINYKLVSFQQNFIIDISFTQIVILILSIIVCFYFNNSNFLIGKSTRE